MPTQDYIIESTNNKKHSKNTNKEIVITQTNYAEHSKSKGDVFLSDGYDAFNNTGMIAKARDVPKNYGNKWTEQEIDKLIRMLKKSSTLNMTKNNIFDCSPTNNSDGNQIIKKIAKKLDRTEGGVKGEITKIIYDRYMNGQTAEQISDSLNITFRNVKSLIKIQLDKESENEIISLEKENKLLKLKIENKRLRQELELLHVSTTKLIN